WVLFSMVAGLLFFQLRIFEISQPCFQITAYGITGAVAFFLFYFNMCLNSSLFLSLLFVLDLLVSAIKSLPYFITHLLFFSAVVLTVYIVNKYFFEKLAAI
ncbi:MAG: hypothetical protein ACE5GL_07290, partial [Calditrichia bacterium]